MLSIVGDDFPLIPKSLHVHHDFFPAPEWLTSDWKPSTLEDTRSVRTRSRVIPVNLPRLQARCSKVEELFGTPRILCCLRPPQRESRIVVHRRELGKDFTNVFLLSEFKFLCSLHDYSRENITQQTTRRQRAHGSSSRSEGHRSISTPASRIRSRNQESSETPTIVSRQTEKNYFLCCEGLKNSDVVDMVLTVAHDFTTEAEGNRVLLTCPVTVKPFLKDLLGVGNSLPTTSSLFDLPLLEIVTFQDRSGTDEKESGFDFSQP